MPVDGISETRTYLTFTLDDEDFAVDVSGVREVLDYTSATKVPRTPEFMRGVINLRGSVVPVVDMRLKFGMARGEDTVDTCIVVLEVDLDGESAVIGALADSVKEVFELTPDLIEPPPRIGTRLDTDFILGMGKHGEQFIIILDVNKVFTVEELSRAKETGGILDALEADGKGVAEESGSPESRRKASSRKKASAGKTPKKKEKKEKIPS